MDRQKIIEAVKGGMTYGQAALRFGVSRNAVAGIMHRARRDERASAIAAGLRAYWEKANHKTRARRLKQLADASRKRWQQAA